jgi:hypothetical protein
MNPRHRTIFVATLVFVLGFLTVGIGSAQNGFPSSVQPGDRPMIASGPVEGPPGSRMQDGEAPSVAPAVTFQSLRLLGATFRPRTNDVNYSVNPMGGCIYATSGNVTTAWNLPLILPQGAKISAVRLYYFDNDTADPPQEAFLVRYDMYGNVVWERYVQSANTGYDWGDIIIDPVEVIDYDTYSYALLWRPYHTGSNTQLCGFRVFYEQPVVADDSGTTMDERSRTALPFIRR